MPAYVASQGALACKMVSFYPDNSSKQISTHMATIILFDEQTGKMRAVYLLKSFNLLRYFYLWLLDNGRWSDYRNEDRCCVSNIYQISCKENRNLSCDWFGCSSNISRRMLPWNVSVFQKSSTILIQIAIKFHSIILKVNIWNHRKSGAEQLAKHLIESFTVEVHVQDLIDDCVKDADVIVVATFATAPILLDVPMNPWVHINC